MSTQYRLVQSGKTASGGCSAGQGFVRAVAPRIKKKIFGTSFQPYLIWDYSMWIVVKFSLCFVHVYVYQVLKQFSLVFMYLLKLLWILWFFK
jgi:hypothetical protein